jgi:hypothetical protein
MKVFYRFDEGFNQFRSKAFCIKMNNFFIKKRGFMFKLCKIYIERIEKIKQQSMSKLEFIEKLFFRQEDARNAFYIIKMSRNKRGIALV